MKSPLRLLTVGHSYVVALNRRLAQEISREGRGRWEVTVASPPFIQGDLRPIHLEKAADENCAVEAVNAYGSRFMHVMFYGWKLRQLLAQPCDFVHAWEEPYIFCGGQIAAWTPKHVPLVYWSCQNLTKTYPPPFSWIERYSVRRCAGWFGCGETVVQTLAPRGYASKPHLVMPFGVDTEIFRPEKNEGGLKLEWNADGTPVVGYLGRFVVEKGIRLLMDALDEIKTPWRALLVGTGPMEADIRAWAARYPGRVHVATTVSHSQVPAYLNAMDMLCAPSQTAPNWREQFGRMLVEAFACGVPVIGSDSGEIPYVVGDAGLIAGETDKQAWVRVISELLESPARRRELGARGRERALANYAWPVLARRHLAFFEQILGSGSGSS